MTTTKVMAEAARHRAAPIDMRVAAHYNFASLIRRAPTDGATPDGRGALLFALAVVAAGLLAVLRGLPFVVWPHAAFDSDQAIVGLMAKHLAEGRAFPLFFYGQPYMLGVQAWLAAPLFALAGTSIALLKLPLLFINGAAAALLVWLLVRDAGLRAAGALAAAGTFVLCAPVAGAQLVAAMGGSIEPALYVLLIWMSRRRPMLCGLIASIGFLHREFTIYGLGALLVVDVIYAAGAWRQLASKWFLLAIAFVIGLEGVRVVRPYGDTFGPELPRLEAATTGPTFYAITTRLACATGDDAGLNLAWLFEHNLPTLFGTAGRGADEYFVGPAIAPRAWLWYVLVAGLLLAAARTAALGWRQRRAPPAFVVYLFAVASFTCLFYVASCDVRAPVLVRYTLLALFGPVAVAAAYLRVESIRPLRMLVFALLVGWMALHALQYLTLTRSYASSTPLTPRGRLAAWLDDRHIRYARASFWDAHYITFDTDERVIVASGYPQRILVYDSLVARAPEVMILAERPCPGATAVHGFWLCSVENRPDEQPPPVPFPTRRDLRDFRDRLEITYRDALGRSPMTTVLDRGSRTAWLQQYVRYRMSTCDHDTAASRVYGRIDGNDVQPACGSVRLNAAPTREQVVDFRRRLEATIVRDGQPAGDMTAVDQEGEAVWTLEYVLGRVNGCTHPEAIARVLAQIGGRAVGRGC